jgi:hypothetical protein
MDAVLVYTADAAKLWAALMASARRRSATVHGEPPEVAIELREARLYINEGPVDADAPVEVGMLGDEVRQFVVDIHNAVEAERFLAESLINVAAVVDDDHGNVATANDYVRRWLGEAG